MRRWPIGNTQLFIRVTAVNSMTGAFLRGWHLIVFISSCPGRTHESQCDVGSASQPLPLALQVLNMQLMEKVLEGAGRPLDFVRFCVSTDRERLCLWLTLMQRSSFEGSVSAWPISFECSRRLGTSQLPRPERLPQTKKHVKKAQPITGVWGRVVPRSEMPQTQLGASQK